MAYTTATLITATLTDNGFLRTVIELTGNANETPLRVGNDFSTAPDMSQLAKQQLDRVNGLVAVVVAPRGPIALPTPPTPPDPPTKDQIDRATFVEAALHARSAQKAFDAGLISEAALTEAQGAMKTAFKSGYESLLVSLP